MIIFTFDIFNFIPILKTCLIILFQYDAKLGFSFSFSSKLTAPLTAEIKL